MAGKRRRIDSNFQLKKRGNRCFDRISLLSDDILVDILSFLSLKEAARTSVLSSRWINVWKHTPSLNFDAQSTLDKIFNQQEKWRELLETEKRKYVKWVNSVLQSHKSLTLKEFRICFQLTKSSRKTINQWLEFALSRQVERLELDFGFLNGDDLPKYCFPEELIVQSPSDIDHPRMLVGFKSLKALSLKTVNVNDRDIDYLLHNCPLLEQLIVHGSEKISKLEVCGSSLMLKHLEIVYCAALESLKVSAPRLTTLVFRKSLKNINGLSLENVPMLTNVTVICRDDSISIKHILHVLSCCISLQTLCLVLHRRDYFEAEMDELCELPKMPKLKKLSIEYFGRDEESLIRLSALIRASPYLEEFVFQFCWDVLPRKDREMKDAIRSPHHHLKLFKFSGRYGSTGDVELLSYILENCVALEKIIIDPFRLYEPTKLEVPQIARDAIKQKLAPRVPQHIELVIL